MVSALPNMAPSEIMNRVKSRSSSKLFEEFPHIKRDIGVEISGREDVFAAL